MVFMMSRSRCRPSVSSGLLSGWRKPEIAAGILKLLGATIALGTPRDSCMHMNDIEMANMLARQYPNASLLRTIKLEDRGHVHQTSLRVGHLAQLVDEYICITPCAAYRFAHTILALKDVLPSMWRLSRWKRGVYHTLPHHRRSTSTTLTLCDIQRARDHRGSSGGGVLYQEAALKQKLSISLYAKI